MTSALVGRHSSTSCNWKAGCTHAFDCNKAFDCNTALDCNKCTVTCSTEHAAVEVVLPTYNACQLDVTA